MPHTQSFPVPHFQVPRPANRNASFVYWSVAPATKAIVFLHGLWGDAQTTWGLEFFRQLRASPRSSGYDVFSLGYGSTRSALVSSSELMKITKLIFEDANKIFSTSLAAERYLDQPDSRGPFSYESVLFVCHSLGALLFRRMVAEVHAKSELWANKLSSVLLAPAHRGGRPLLLAQQCGIPAVAAAAYLGLYNFPVLEDLSPGSIFVRETAEKTADALKHSASNAVTSLICNNVGHADGDRVVDMQAPFCSDPMPFEIFYGHSHTSICKVNHRTQDALMYLLKVLA